MVAKHRVSTVDLNFSPAPMSQLGQKAGLEAAMFVTEMMLLVAAGRTLIRGTSQTSRPRRFGPDL
jgi:hypothetical protein